MEEKALKPIREIIARQGHERVVLLVDTSGSMEGMMPATGKGQLKIKIHAAVEAVIAITNVSDPKVTKYGVVEFESVPHDFLPISDDYFTIQMKINNLRTKGGTAMNHGISHCIHLEPLPNRIVLLSDGEPTCSEADLYAVVDSAATLGVRIDTIAIGGASDLIMREIARRTGGTFHRAEDAAQLAQHFMMLETRNQMMIEDKR